MTCPINHHLPFMTVFLGEIPRTGITSSKHNSVMGLFRNVGSTYTSTNMCYSGHSKCLPLGISIQKEKSLPSE